MERAPRRLVTFERWPDPVVEERLAEAPEIETVRLQHGDPPERVMAVLATAHGYNIVPIRREGAYDPTAELIARCPKLLAVSSQGAGFDTVDVAACTRAGVLVVSQGGLNAGSVVEHVIGMMIVLSKRIQPADRALRRDRKWHRLDFTGDDISGRTLGVIGLGNIGGRLARLAGDAFAMEVLATDPYLTAEQFAERGAELVALDELLARADFVSVNAPLTEETAGMIGAREYALMKPTAYFITTARGGIHDEAGLAAALGRGAIAGAGLDVWAPEPPPLDHPLLQFDNVVLSPHNAGVTRQSYRRVGEGLAEQWRAIFRGERPPRLQNPQAWGRYLERYREMFGG